MCWLGYGIGKAAIPSITGSDNSSMHKGARSILSFTSLMNDHALDRYLASILFGDISASAMGINTRTRYFFALH